MTATGRRTFAVVVSVLALMALCAVIAYAEGNPGVEITSPTGGSIRGTDYPVYFDAS